MRQTHIYATSGPGGFYISICGLRSDVDADLFVVSTHLAARLVTGMARVVHCSADRHRGQHNPPALCDTCFSDPRVTMKVLAIA